MTNQDSINYNECFYTVSELNYEYVAIMDPDEVWLVFVLLKKRTGKMLAAAGDPAAQAHQPGGPAARAGVDAPKVPGLLLPQRLLHGQHGRQGGPRKLPGK